MPIITKQSHPNWLKNLVRRYEKKGAVAVGFPLGTSSVSQIYPDTDVTVLDTAVWNNFGVASKNIPPRPFMSLSSIAIIKRTKGLRKQLVDKLNMDKITKQKAYGVLGAVSASIVKEEIVNLTTPPNAPITIARKSSSNPLIDTGAMMGAVTWVVRDKEEKA